MVGLCVSAPVCTPILGGWAIEGQRTRQRSQTGQDVEAALAINDRFPGLRFLQGFACCNLRDYASAEAAYTRGLEIDPGFILLHLLRAEARLRQDDQVGAMQDLNAVQESAQGETLGPLVEAAMSGKLSCERLFQGE